MRFKKHTCCVGVCRRIDQDVFQTIVGFEFLDCTSYGFPDEFPLDFTLFGANPSPKDERVVTLDGGVL